MKRHSMGSFGHWTAWLTLLGLLLPAPPLAAEDAAAVLEAPPRPVGGMEALSAEIVYPAAEKLAGVEGEVRATVTVEADGRVSACRGEGASEALRAEALRALRTIAWTPGLVDGKPVRAEVLVPVRFRLRAKQETPDSP